MTSSLYSSLSFAVLGLAGLLIALLVTRLAPEGFEDEFGFRYGNLRD